MTEPNATGQSAAEAFLLALESCGIRHVLANGGTDFAPIIEGILRLEAAGRAIPQFVTVPHENVAVAMAQGYAKTCDRPAAVMVHVNVGTANTICGVMNAARDNVPILLAAGRTPLTESGHLGSRDASIHWAQENFDQAAILREHVKWDYELRAGQPVATLVARAIDIAMSEPRGPVYLSLPREVLGAELVDAGPPPRPRAFGAVSAVPSAASIEAAAKLIASAEMPLIVAGRSGRFPGAFEALGELAADCALPVASGPALNIASSHPMNLGFVTRALLAAADVIVVIDAPVPWIPSAMQPVLDAKLVHIAHDPLYADYPLRGFPMDLAIAGDPAAAIALLHDALRMKQHDRQASLDGRRRKIAEMRRRIDDERAAFLTRAASMLPIHPAFVAHALNQVKDKDAIIVEELGAAFPFLDLEVPGTFISGTSGALGMGLGQALGAKLAAPERQVIATVGDGSYMFGVPSAAHFVACAEKLPTLTMILNNSQWGAVRRAAVAMYPQGLAAKANSLPLVDLTPSPAYEKISEAFGGTGERVEDPQKLVAAVDRALDKVAAGIPVTLNVITAPRDSR
jgi:acetolactate synthase-1/2/3 large subunit